MCDLTRQTLHICEKEEASSGLTFESGQKEIHCLIADTRVVPLTGWEKVLRAVTCERPKINNTNPLRDLNN